ncbi:MAG: hypothetical protein SAK29_14460 [Scytonema sp. PMC 1069.18]|nr:hypothetical protein [Scytonema sp. PMC 1069.18]MEC4884154.1 hypothetical protein [Scytonema sp. PMC 1070.18]
MHSKVKSQFIDSGILIAAARGEGAIAQKVLAILQDPNRIFVSSIFLKLEVRSYTLNKTHAKTQRR